MYVVKKHNIPKLVNYGFRARNEGKCIYKYILIKGKYYGDLYFDVSSDKEVYELKLRTHNLKQLPSIIFFMLNDEILEYR